MGRGGFDLQGGQPSHQDAHQIRAEPNLKVNQIYATSARRSRALLEKSRYAAKVRNQREAVLQVRDLEDAKVQKTLDPVLQQKVNKLIIDSSNESAEKHQRGQ
jgi:membrane peptidoglycan carboxypeptidase